MKLSGLKVELAREEYDAFCYLRDITCEDLKMKIARLERAVEQFDMLEKQSKAVINSQSVSMEQLRAKNFEQHTLIMKMQERLAQLEPMRSAVEQPLFASRK